MFEHSNQPLLHRRSFYLRVARHGLFALLLIAAALIVGTVGYHVFGELDWVDSLLNASMILTGMGPVNPMHTTAAKLFASGYAIFSGIAFLGTVGVLLAPLVHRFLHEFHLDDDDIDDSIGR